ncbi:MAG: enoyl-CoA hydratase/isomerase family protein [Thermodesulfobacteriota bacterium]
MEFTTLLFDVKDHIATITLNRPDSANAINLDFSKDLLGAILRCDEDPEIRVVVITGKGSLFCAGGDLKEFVNQGSHLPYHIKKITTYLHSAISRMIRMDALTIAAVNGFAVGAGLSLALACDFVLATPSARFSVAYTRVGLTPDGGMSYILPRVVGLRRALELTLTNRILSAQEALDWGLVNQVVEEEKLLAQVEILAKQLVSGPPISLGISKRLLHMGWNETLETQMENESQSISHVSRTLDAKEGMTAFLEKRIPKYKGT